MKRLWLPPLAVGWSLLVHADPPLVRSRPLSLPRVSEGHCAPDAPRCGVVRGPATQQQRWPVERIPLTWSVESTPTPHAISRDAVRAVFRRAAAIWSDACGIKFIEVDSLEDATIRIGFFRRRHARHGHSTEIDPSFDGPGGVLAHAFYPGDDPVCGDIHIDLDEVWTDDPAKAGLDLVSTMAHELGHALGFDHVETDPDALMAPLYNGRRSLTPSEARSARARYGEPTRKPILDRSGELTSTHRYDLGRLDPGTLSVAPEGDVAWRLGRDRLDPSEWREGSKRVRITRAGLWFIELRGSGKYSIVVRRP